MTHPDMTHPENVSGGQVSGQQGVYCQPNRLLYGGGNVGIWREDEGAGGGEAAFLRGWCRTDQEHHCHAGAYMSVCFDVIPQLDTSHAWRCITLQLAVPGFKPTQLFLVAQ